MRLGRRLSSMRITKPAKHSLRLRTVASMGYVYLVLMVVLNDVLEEGFGIFW
ncbi:unnamed protein product [Ectocarpus sp. CCAP 1310/34]|nr:unnamed protein product [Ectocarpus sp. CCAP 1310/34]